MQEAELVLCKAWRRLIGRYASGEVVLRNEANMEKALKNICREIPIRHNAISPVVSQEYHRGRIVDLRIGDKDSCILVQLKLYHDRADWRETRSMTNTVESDLKFAKGHGDTYVGLIDTIPSTSRTGLPFNLKWQTIEIDKQVFGELYAHINPRTSPPRERRQKSVLAKGTEI